MLSVVLHLFSESQIVRLNQQIENIESLKHDDIHSSLYLMVIMQNFTYGTGQPCFQFQLH